MIGTNPHRFLDEIFPNEVIRMFLEPLSNRQRIGVQRVSRVWCFLSRSLLDDLKRFVNTEYPFLVEGKELTDAEYVSAFERQPKIYAELAQRYCVSPEALRRENLIASQDQRLTALKIASGLIDTDPSVGADNIFRLMACIGNSEKLKRWFAPAGVRSLSEISAITKCWALREAAVNGQIECVRYLIKKCGPEISAEDKGVAFRWAAGKGHIECVRYLIDKCESEISHKYKKKALQDAKDRNHEKYVEYLEQYLHLASAASIATSLTYTPAATYSYQKNTKNNSINSESEKQPSPFKHSGG